MLMYRSIRGTKARKCRSTVARVSLLAMMAGLATYSPVSAHVHHSADGGSVRWYPRECCHDGDCHPVSRIQPAAEGLLMTTEDGFTFLVNPRNLRRPSLDSHWHVCVTFDELNNPAVLCIFEPPSS
jgi:hypothetical protein